MPRYPQAETWGRVCDSTKEMRKACILNSKDKILLSNKFLERVFYFNRKTGEFKTPESSILVFAGENWQDVIDSQYHNFIYFV